MIAFFVFVLILTKLLNDLKLTSPFGGFGLSLVTSLTEMSVIWPSALICVAVQSCSMRLWHSCFDLKNVKFGFA